MNYRYLSLPLAIVLVGTLVACNTDNDARSTPDFVTELSLEHPDGDPAQRFSPGTDAMVVLSVRNRGNRDQTLEFNDQRVNDFVVLNADGDAVRVWSTPYDFAQVITEVTIPAGETERFEMLWEGLRDDQGELLPEGEYEIQGWLPTRDEDGIDDLQPGPLRSTLVPFEIAE